MVYIDSKDKNLLEKADIDGDNTNIAVRVSLDMFREAAAVIRNNGYAVMTDENGMKLSILKWLSNTYLHKYIYSGVIDTEFLDNYDCLFLHGCNEFSVELCRTALGQWNGKKLVLVGEDWKYIVEYLPDFDNIECFWEDSLDGSFYAELTGSTKFLHITIGLTGAESMERYEKNIMTYDEIMCFTYFFSEKRNCGELNSDKKFWIYDTGCKNLGIFNIFNKTVACAAYAKKKGYIPVPLLNDETITALGIYQDRIGDDVWAKFYEQPEGYSIEEVLKSRNVFISPKFYCGTIMQNLMNSYSEGTELAWPNGKYNKRLTDYIEKRKSEFLPYPEKTLGVLARGTDYVHTHLRNHAVHADPDMIFEKIDKLIQEWNLEYIYLATEDASYCELFKKRYGDRVFFTDQERFTVKEGEKLAEMHRRNKNKRDGFLLGAEYILSIYLLSKCNSMIASGGCAGVGEAIKMNDGKYKHTFVFDLGIN